MRTYQMGERATAGHLIYTAFETEWLPQVGEGAEQRLPKNRFFLVKISIGNSGSSDQIAPSLSLLDDNGNSYPELTAGQGVRQWIGAIRKIKPTEAAQGNLVFDVAPRHYKLRIADEDDQQPALIDIPLSFGTELPDAPGATPEGKAATDKK